MNNKNLFGIRLSITGIVTIGIWSLLAWNHFHGGVPSHHLLAREDLPEISNWWGGLSLPLFSWLMIYRIQKRDRLTEAKFPKKVMAAFLMALLYGIVLSVFFSFGYNDIPFYMFIGAWVTALFFPIYRSECMLGFVIGLTYTFGAVLPMFIGSVIIAIGFMIHQVIRPFFCLCLQRLTKLFNRTCFPARLLKKISHLNFKNSIFSKGKTSPSCGLTASNQ